MFWPLTLAMLALLGTATSYAYRRSRDVFHPLVYLSPMLAFLYCYMPWNAAIDGGLYDYLSSEVLAFSQTVHLLGAAALVVGVLVGARPMPRAFRHTTVTTGRSWRAASAIGLLSLAAFGYGVASVGGFEQAYGRAYGGGWSQSGYVRDLVNLGLPAAAYLVAPTVGAGALLQYGMAITVASPFLIHGLLGARRGPTFMILAGIATSWFLTRGKRPSATVIAVAGALLGLGLLFLVANRSNIYLGSDWQLERTPTEMLEAGGGNEFVYSSGLIADTWDANSFTWGARYAVTLFVRPIPRALWPNKYLVASEVLGLPSMEENLGIDYRGMRRLVGWEGAVGAAPGIIADLWTEFSWVALALLLAIGYLYGWVWRRTAQGGGPWAIVYSVMVALSIFLVMQTLEAWLVRLLEMGFAVALLSRVRQAKRPQDVLAALSRRWEGKRRGRREVRG